LPVRDLNSLPSSEVRRKPRPLTPHPRRLLGRTPSTPRFAPRGCRAFEDVAGDFGDHVDGKQAQERWRRRECPRVSRWWPRRVDREQEIRSIDLLEMDDLASRAGEHAGGGSLRSVPSGAATSPGSVVSCPDSATVSRAARRLVPREPSIRMGQKAIWRVVFRGAARAVAAGTSEEGS